MPTIKTPPESTKKFYAATLSEQRDFLMTAITWQESLLQGYRSVHATIQGLLLTAGATVLAVQLTSASQIAPDSPDGQLGMSFVSNLLLSLIIGFLFWIQYRAAIELGKVIKNRALDVDFWHKELVVLENEFPSEQRTLSTFKLMQQARRTNTEHLFVSKYKNNAIAREQIDEIIKKGLEHTRNVLDNNLFNRLQLLWKMILVISIGISTWFCVIYFL